MPILDRVGKKQNRDDDHGVDLSGSRHPLESETAHRRSLGALLVEAGFATKKQVKKAIAEGLETGERLGEVVVRKGWATEEELAELLAEQWQLHFARAHELWVDDGAMRLLTADAARELGVMPIGFDEHSVLLAIADPGRKLFKAVEKRFGDASYVVVTGSVLDQLHRHGYGSGDGEGSSEGVQELDVSTAAESSGSAVADVQAGPLVDAVLESIDAATAELARVRDEVAALGASLSLARDQLAEQEAELEAAKEERDRHAERIRGLEAELAHRTDLFEALRRQVAKLAGTLEDR